MSATVNPRPTKPDSDQKEPLQCKLRKIEGCLYGSKQPIAVAGLSGMLISDQQLATLKIFFESELLATIDSAATELNIAEFSGLEALAKLLADCLYHMQRSVNLNVQVPGQILAVVAQTGSAVVTLPSPRASQRSTIRVFKWLISLTNAVLQSQNYDALLQSRQEMLARLGRRAPAGSNVPRFLSAAHELDIPSLALPGEIQQYGFGSRSRWMNSSFTDETSGISVTLARIKSDTARILHEAGLPVPDHKLVKDAEAAVAIAEKIGYPVVLKPADKDGGQGVVSGLISPEEVKAAFKTASGFSNNVLVEKHINGKDYRLNVFRNECIWAIERVPGGVTGDGKHTITELVSTLNSDPRRGEDTHSPLKLLKLDEEAQTLLQRAQIDGNTIPASGEFVRLRRNANVATGGTPVPVFDQVHPDNAELAIRACAALRLDLAGVDLLMPDITKSWKQVGGAICEVNAQPNLGQTTSAHLYPRILKQLLTGNGRVPIAVVVGAEPDNKLVAALGEALIEGGLRAACHDRSGITINGRRIWEGAITPNRAATIMLGDRDVDAIILSINDQGVLHSGLPFDRFDLLIRAGSHYQLSTNSEQTVASLSQELYRALRPACAGQAIDMASGTDNMSSPGDGPTENEKIEQLAKLMLGADERHRTALDT